MSDSPSATSASPPQPTRRIVTGHNPSGKAVFLEDGPVQPRSIEGAFFTDLFRTEEFPVSNSVEFADKAKGNEELTSKGGTIFRVVDIPPGAVSPFHRTLSTDYVILVKGTLSCQLDDGKRVRLNVGDVLVQRGTIHAWINDTDQWARTIAVMEDALPVEIEGKTLPSVFEAPPTL